MKKATWFNTFPSFKLFMMSLYFGFLGLFMPWSFASFRTFSVGASMHIETLHFLSFWQTSFWALKNRYAPCRTWIITQANTPQGHILNFVQMAGFSVLFMLVSLWLLFLWEDAKALTQVQRQQLLITSLFLIVGSALIVVRMSTFADCSLTESIALLDVQFCWMSLLFPILSVLFGTTAILKSTATGKGSESQ